MNSLLLGVSVLVGALVLGELAYRSRGGAARLWGDVSQLLYGIVSVFILGIIVLAGPGSAFTAAILGLFIAGYYALARTRFDDVADTDIRKAVAGDE